MVPLTIVEQSSPLGGTINPVAVADLQFGQRVAGRTGEIYLLRTLLFFFDDFAAFGLTSRQIDPGSEGEGASGGETYI